MPTGQYDRTNVVKPEDYEIESLEETACRLELIARQIYYLGKDGETTGYTDYKTLETFVNCMLYSVLEYEKRIKRSSQNKYTGIKRIHKKTLKVSERMKKNLEDQYKRLRAICNDRLREGKIWG